MVFMDRKNSRLQLTMPAGRRARVYRHYYCLIYWDFFGKFEMYEMTDEYRRVEGFCEMKDMHL